jgi:sulfane dehydrogenase subunit SoxC
MAGSAQRSRGRIRAAPENHLTPAQVGAVPARRGFLGGAAAAGVALAASGAAAADPKLVAPWTRRLGAPVAQDGYGMPSKHEAAVQRRQSPGLTRTPLSSVSFTPLQNLFGIVTPSGVHFERHHSGMPEVDPGQHRLMVHGLVARPLVFTMDELMRFPSV